MNLSIMILPITKKLFAVVDQFLLFTQFEVVCEFYTVDYDPSVLCSKHIHYSVFVTKRYTVFAVLYPGPRAVFLDHVCA